MGNEILIILSIGLLIGVGVGYILFVKFNFGKKFIEMKEKKIINSPEKLKEALEKNGEFIDDGKRISYKIEKDKDGKDILKQVVSELPKTIKKKDQMKKQPGKKQKAKVKEKPKIKPKQKQTKKNSKKKGKKK